MKAANSDIFEGIAAIAATAFNAPNNSAMYALEEPTPARFVGVDEEGFAVYEGCFGL